MKRAVLFSVLLTLCFITLAQTPESFNYQVVVRDGVSNNPLTNQDVSFRMSILKGSVSGESQYSELHSANTGALGIVNLIIGNGTGKTGNITTIDWGADTYFLKVEIDKTGGSSYVEMGTTQLLSVPYALSAKTAETYTETQTIADAAAKGNLVNTQLKNLTDPTETQDAATKSYVDELNARVDFLELIAKGFYDSRDNIHYGVVKIGYQVWMAENLKYLPAVVGRETGSQTVPYYYVYGYDGTDLNSAKATIYYNTYGVLYNWSAAMDGASSSSENPSGIQGICPTGWHLPSETEWAQLSDFLGGDDYAGGKLKEGGIAHWANCNSEVTNESGYTALPGGVRSSAGNFGVLAVSGYWWSSTEGSSSFASYRKLDDMGSNFEYNGTAKDCGMSVRCIKD